MTEKELFELRDLAEQGKVQFKERALDKNDISAEMSAFANNGSKYEFIVTIPRNSNQEKGETIQEIADASKKTIQEQLTKKRIDILNFCTVPRSAQEIMDRLGLSNQNYNRRHNIRCSIGTWCT